jgi:hypothetical protein
MKIYNVKKELNIWELLEVKISLGMNTLTA